MMTLRPDPHEAVREPIRLPPLLSSFASLSPMEKSLLGHFMVLSRPRLIVEVGVYPRDHHLFHPGFFAPQRNRRAGRRVRHDGDVRAAFAGERRGPPLGRQKGVCA